MPAILDGPGDFAHPIRTGRNLVFKLDGHLDIPFVIPQQAQLLPNRRVPLAEGSVGARFLDRRPRGNPKICLSEVVRGSLMVRRLT